MHRTPTIAIAGAGAAGAPAALALAKAGMDVVLIERDREPGAGIPCGGGVVTEYLDNLGVDPALVDHWIRRIKVHSRGVLREWEFAVPMLASFKRAVVDKRIFEKAVAAGARPLIHCAVRRFNEASGHLAIEHLSSRTHETIEVDLLINAAGCGAHLHGVECGVTPSTPRCAAAYMELRSDGEDRDFFEFFLDGLEGKPGYFWVFPKGDRLNVGVGWLASCGISGMTERLVQFIGSRSELCDRQVLRRHGGVLPVQRARRLVGRRSLAVGDAAGLVNPFTGGGLVFAQKSAALAARCIIEGYAVHKAMADILTAYDRNLRRSIYWRWLQVVNPSYRWLVGRTVRRSPHAFATAMRWYFQLMSLTAQVVSEYRGRFQPRDRSRS
ncbi:NAD(P)/FAD-dependent oxidoreductase [bacterium]|nr:NAD(P)/FAD-dependent oxidoreductase [candidate division CSSED10-310 bacterium]